MSEQTEVKRGNKPRNVDYELEVVDELPGVPARTSPLEESLGKIKDNERLHGRVVCIGKYANGTAATAAANVLRQRHGNDAKYEGWTVTPRRLGDEENRTGLFVQYQPDRVIDGAMAEWTKREDARKAKLKDKRAEGNGGGEKAQKPGDREKAPAAKGPAK